MKWIKEMFGLTEQGARGLVKASFSSFLMYCAYMVPIFVIMYFVENVLQGQNLKAMYFAGGILVLALFMYAILHYNYNTLFTETYKESANLRIEIANLLKRLPISYFSRHDTSDLSQTIMKDVGDIEHAMSHAIPQTIGFGVYFIIVGISMLIGNPILGLCILLPIVGSFLLLVLSKRMQIKATTKYYEALRENSEAFQEAIELQQEIRSYGRVDMTKESLMKQMERSEKTHILAEIYQAIPTILSGSILRFSLGITILVGSILYFRGQVSLLYFLGYLIAASKIIEGVNGIYLNLAEIMYIDARIKRIKELGEVEIQGGEELPLDTYDIALNEVEFSYQEGVKVIDKVSFLAKQNEVTALVGPSGCGKTTLLKLMSRLYDYDAGNILLEGKEINKIETEHLFEKISIVFQEVLLFNTSIMENIRVGKREASDEEVKEAAKLANCDDFIERLPEGYNTIIGENGNQLSGGERQRLSIARAFLKNAPIIILDEVAASLDIENERKIQESLSRLTRGKTLIVISHRLKSIEEADKIVVLNQGRVEAVGDHEELSQNCKLYQSMLEKSRATEEYQY